MISFVREPFKGKTIIVTGPRQVGKTTLLKKVLGDHDFLFLDGHAPFNCVVVPISLYNVECERDYFSTADFPPANPGIIRFRLR